MRAMSNSVLIVLALVDAALVGLVFYAWWRRLHPALIAGVVVLLFSAALPTAFVVSLSSGSGHVGTQQIRPVDNAAPWTNPGQ